MIIISWDVGVIHLAYCVLEYKIVDEKETVTIIDWDEINLIEDARIKLSCCGKMKAKKNQNADTCCKNASYFMNTPAGEIYGFCKTHLGQSNDIWSVSQTKKMFTECHEKHSCGFIKKDGSECAKNTKYSCHDGTNKIYLCTAHYKSELHKRIKQYSPQPIRNMIVKKYPTADLQLNLIKKLDNLAPHFALLNIEEVIIENQPSMKNPKMKAIASTLFDYFMIRGYIDKIHNLDIKMVRFMCPSNKLRVNENNTIEVFKANRDKTKKYKLTKELGMKYTRQLLADSPEQIEYLNLYKKQDDVCDAYLQGRYYLQFIKNKPKNDGSKTKKKSLKKKKKSNKIPDDANDIVVL